MRCPKLKNTFRRFVWYKNERLFSWQALKYDIKKKVIIQQNICFPLQSNSIIAIRFTAIPVWIVTKENKHNDISKSHFFDRSLTKLLLSSNCLQPENSYFIFKMIFSLNTSRQKPHWFQAKGISYIDYYKSKNSLIAHCMQKCNAHHLTFKLKQ